MRGECIASPSTSWPPSEAAIQGPLVLTLALVVLDGRVKPGHGVGRDPGSCPQQQEPLQSSGPESRAKLKMAEGALRSSLTEMGRTSALVGEVLQLVEDTLTPPHLKDQ